MQLAKVIGTVVASQKYVGLEHCKMLLIQPLTSDLKPTGKLTVAIDSVQAGEGDLVHWVAAREAALACPVTFVPVDAAIVGIVDDVNVDDVGIHDKKQIFRGQK